MSPARRIAFDILLQAGRGGHASDQLLHRTAALDSRDAGLTAEIVFGCLRYQAQLDFLASRYSAKPAGRLDAEVRVALRMGIYQLRYLDRVPAHAAVAETVELVKRAGKRSAAGFVNALLRRVRRDPVVWPGRATELSMPDWLLERWDRRFGTETTDRIARTFLRPPELYVRLDPRSLPPPPHLEPTDVPGCFRVAEGKAGGLRIQDIGSQSIVPLLDLRPGQRFLDLCASPGNKTAQAMEAGVRAVACDVSARRLAPLHTLGCPRVALDGTRPLPFRGVFDRILIDAPCSGTGTLGRNPEIKWRLKPEDLLRHHERQVKLLTSGLACLAPGGRLVYSTCSLEEEENEAVVREVLGCPPPVEMRRTPGLLPGDGFYAAVLGST